MNVWILIAAMTAITFGIRYAMFAVADRFTFPKGVTDALRYVPPAVLTAILVPAVLIPNGMKIDIGWTNPYLIGAIAATVTGFLAKRLILTIVVGMAVFFVWQFVIV